MARANRYLLSDPDGMRTKLMAGSLKGQTSLIIGTMVNSEDPLSVQEIAEKISDRLVTRQDPIRVVGFYISTWKKTGMVKAVDQVPPVEPSAETTQPPAETVTFESAQQVVAEPVIETVDLPVEVEVEQPPSAEEQFKADIAKATKLRDAIFSVIQYFPGVDTDEIVTRVQQNWKAEVGRKQVNDSLLKLAKHDEIRREQHTEGHYGFFTV